MPGGPAAGMIMPMKKITTGLAFAAALAAAPAMADTLAFGQPLVGNGPAFSFATLSVTQVGNGDDWQFTLDASGLSAGATLATLAFEVAGAVPNYRNGLAMTGVSGGVGSVTARNGGGPTGVFDFRLDLGQGQDRLAGGETVSWTWNDSGHGSFSSVALQVQGLPGGTAWYAPSAPVPEPASALMMLAGAGVLLWARRRRAD